MNETIKDLTNENDRKNLGKLFQLMIENPGVPVIPVITNDVIKEGSFYSPTTERWWTGHWECELVEIYQGRRNVHIKDEECFDDVLRDVTNKDFPSVFHGDDIDIDSIHLYLIPDEELEPYYNSLPWEKCIAVYISQSDYREGRDV